MHRLTVETSYGCLLHDFGKIVYRAGGRSGTHSSQGWNALRELLPGSEWKPVLECLRWHHGRELRQGNPPADHPAYIAYIADNLSAALDRREIEGEDAGRFVRDMPLQPIFTHMNGEHPGYSLSPTPQDGSLRQPGQGSTFKIAPQYYAQAEREIKAGLRGTAPGAEFLNSLLVLLESWTSTFPSSTFSGESPDISLYDHLKTTAAIGACISEYLLEHKVRDFKKTLFDGEKEFRTKPCFLLYSADLSGIQSFIYSISTAQALRSLRGRSFFLGLLMEHYVDEVLEGCGLSRANLLYSGGGHCYLLLPNTPSVLKVLQEFNLKFNDFLLDEFGSGLFLAHGWTECCGNDLINVPAAQTPYKEMFRRVSGKISAHKFHRYTPEQLLRMNQNEAGEDRECRICGRTDHLKDDLCEWCRTFIELSPEIQGKDLYVVMNTPDKEANFALPSLDGTAYFCFTDEKSARARLKKNNAVRRIYTKNKSYTGLRYSTRIYVGDYAYSNQMEELASESKGVHRLAVCRMDVDDLGHAFVRGFENEAAQTPAERYHYVTLSRTAAFSRQISLFFQLYINDILSGKYDDRSQLAVTIVYSGGDDVFLVGAWNDVVEASVRIQTAFDAFTCHALTISGGIGVFDDHFPIRMAAYRTEELESRAKKEPHKNAVSLFDPRENHTYGWRIFQNNVLKDKEKTLETYFGTDTQRGNSFLYRLVYLLRPTTGDDSSINLARYAYQLARMEPKRSDPKYGPYKLFADSMYSWALNRSDREQLITAIYLYVYQNREGVKNELSKK